VSVRSSFRTTTAYSLPFDQANAGVGDAVGVGVTSVAGSGGRFGGTNSWHAASMLTTATTTAPATTFRNMANVGNLQ
jgi:hypothetical protein